MTRYELKRERRISDVLVHSVLHSNKNITQMAKICVFLKLVEMDVYYRCAPNCSKIRIKRTSFLNSMLSHIAQ